MSYICYNTQAVPLQLCMFLHATLNLFDTLYSIPSFSYSDFSGLIKFLIQVTTCRLTLKY